MKCCRTKTVGLALMAAMAGWLGYTLTAVRRENSTSRPTSRWQERVWELTAQGEQARQTEQWNESVEIYGELTRYAPYDPYFRFEHALALARVGRTNEAIEALARAIDLGWADVQAIELEADFAPLRGDPAFGSLTKQADAMASQEIVIHVPPGLDGEKAAPLLVVFHGLGENPHRHIGFWTRAADQAGVVVAAPRGIRRIGGRSMHAFRWDGPSEGESSDAIAACRQALALAVAAAQERTRIDVDRVILAGYSQGGYVALRLLAESPESYRGAVVEAPSYSPRLMESWKSGDDGPNVRVCIFVHELDKMRAEGESAFQALRGRGVACRLQVMAGADHEFPLDHEAGQVEAIRYVLSAKEGKRVGPSSAQGDR